MGHIVIWSSETRGALLTPPLSPSDSLVFSKLSLTEWPLACALFKSSQGSSSES